LNIYLLWVLYRLLSGVSKMHASLMVIFGVAFVPIMWLLIRGAEHQPLEVVA